ncbi:DUF2197 domain-containing protein [Kroppenstedtia pulmonis]|uniref:DUF2197 domain-containing protein n=1 Tax=Kroppenstedtia pulmonis TaxID=1380685 RepID=A0A7D3Y5C8_9BACL|nr:DUF2197 domain-containing protein [Kroppenstedtia pulmonis]
MKVSCVLCDQIFILTSGQTKRIRKYPHRVPLCPKCDLRIRQQTLTRKSQQNKDI